MIIWRGWGFVSVLFALAGAFLGALLADRNLAFKYPSSLYLVAAGFVLAAAANWFAGRALNRTRREAGASLTNRHSLFWIAMEWWSLPMLAAAAYLLIQIASGKA